MVDAGLNVQLRETIPWVYVDLEWRSVGCMGKGKLISDHIWEYLKNPIEKQIKIGDVVWLGK